MSWIVIFCFNFFARTSRHIYFLAMVHNSHSLSTDLFLNYFRVLQASISWGERVWDLLTWLHVFSFRNFEYMFSVAFSGLQLIISAAVHQCLLLFDHGCLARMVPIELSFDLLQAWEFLVIYMAMKLLYSILLYIRVLQNYHAIWFRDLMRRYQVDWTLNRSSIHPIFCFVFLTAIWEGTVHITHTYNIRLIIFGLTLRRST
jgi:hypothetical protein